MAEAAAVYVRYDLPNEKGQTRRELNDIIDESGAPIVSPSLVIPEHAQYLWDWFTDLTQSLDRAREGVIRPFPPSEFLAWKEATGNIVYPREYAILRQMDAAFCAELNKEAADRREREREEAEKNRRR